MTESKRFSSAIVGSNLSQGKLIERVGEACRRLVDAGWRSLFEAHGLDILAEDLKKELLRPLDRIDRSLPGFEDFALEGTRAIEPGNPSRSLLFHALASPEVITSRVDKEDRQLTDFPTLAELEVIENYVYGVEPPSIEDLRARAGDAPLAIVVFAAEYRPAYATVHRQHADMCYARTGISRVGTAAHKYLPENRGYLPFVDEDGSRIRVIPCRYAAFVAAFVPGKKDGHGPMRFLEPKKKGEDTDSHGPKSGAHTQIPTALRSGRTGDATRNFWVPMHKLFDGDECIREQTLEVRLSANHVNEKIRRAHLFFGANGHDSGWQEPDISEPPFVFKKGIAGFSEDPADGNWVLVPVPHSHLVEPADYKEKPLTFRVPETKSPDDPWKLFSSSLNLRAEPSGARRAPEYLHARHVVTEDGQEQDLNLDKGLIEIVTKGGFQARHYIDFTGDGWIDVECSALALDIPRWLPAYSIVGSPDFFPSVSQSDLVQWTDQSVPPSLLETIWPVSPGKPEPLSDQRYAANLELAGARFDNADDTMTAIVGVLGSGMDRFTRINRPKNRRQSTLPDGAAGVFAPGWDVSYDRSSESDPTDTGEHILAGVTFLNHYGLGSPFVEDAKLCAALSSFWPAVAPDVARTFAPSKRYATATPLPDEIIGFGANPSWDGIRGPEIDRENCTVDYPFLAYGDYVRTALENRFHLTAIAKTSVEDYLARTLTMAMVYEALGAAPLEEKVRWSVLSFRKAQSDDADLADALKSTGRRVNPACTFRFEVCQHDNVLRKHDDDRKFDRRWVKYVRLVLLFADPSIVMQKGEDGRWSVHELRR